MKLYRKALTDYENEWNKGHPNSVNNPEEYISFLDGLSYIISQCEFEPDDRFIPYGRRDFLRHELWKYLNDEIYSGRGKYTDAFIDLSDYYNGYTFFYPWNLPPGSDFRKADKEMSEYEKDGIICKQEIDIINEMITLFRHALREEFEPDEKEIIEPKKQIEVDNSNKNKLLEIERHNWGERARGLEWEKESWIIYDDMTLDYEMFYDDNSTFNINSKNIDVKDMYNSIFINIELAKSINVMSAGCDGEAWEFIQYKDGVEIWHRDLGYIYGNEPLEKISKILLDRHFDLQLD